VLLISNMFLQGHHKYLIMSALRIFYTWVFIITISILVPKPIITVTGQTSAEQLTKLMHEGNFLYTQKKFDQALKSFEKVLALDSNNTFAMDRIGLILHNLGNDKDAIRYFDKSLAIDPNNTATLNNKGLALGILGNHTAALDLFDKVLSIDPNSTDAYINKGAALGVLGKYGDALTSIDKALASDPNNTAALTVKALTLYSAGNGTEAKGYLDKILERTEQLFYFQFKNENGQCNKGMMNKQGFM
jgi:tetratricopeptide (TPR) repeat protein